MGVVELNIRIRDFEKPWLFHVLADLEYPCILGIDFIGGSKTILDFDRKSLAIQESHVEVIKIDDGNLRVHLSETKNLSERLGIRHVKTVVYRPQANRTERVNRDLVQMIANYVYEQHDTWDRFLREFAYAIRTAVNETTEKTPAELFLGRKLITPFQKLVMVRIYHHRNCDETEIGTGSPDNGSLRYKPVVLTEYNGDQMTREMKEKLKGRDKNAHNKRLQSETKKREKRGVPSDHRDEDTTRRTS
ncbi:transposon Ty3-I Gag-Pol polyprotein [Trichonephila clavipes]|uniref:Transposon Ty3-I Gag-Pol polyprotein n=1 Tax=Trichonephila clavipes TaxID=2585209 RepID=A0A8X6VV04_TRICX|nr:transposon Ty3-I Gag-Pol polyprotein [Trichonephila clavipes]